MLRGLTANISFLLYPHGAGVSPVTIDSPTGTVGLRDMETVALRKTFLSTRRGERR